MQIANKKSELMLMRRAIAYSSFCSQVILVYLHPFRRNSFFAVKNRQKITKNQWQLQLFMSGEAKGGKTYVRGTILFFISYLNSPPLSSLHSGYHPIGLRTSWVTTFQSTYVQFCLFQ